MRFAQFLLLAVFTLLQGVAPLLHAHVADGPHNGAGLHAPDIGPPIALAGETSFASERQFPYVDAAEQWRRASGDQALPCAVRSAQAARIDQVPAAVPDITPAPRLSPAYTYPPAQAPPARRA